MPGARNCTSRPQRYARTVPETLPFSTAFAHGRLFARMSLTPENWLWRAISRDNYGALLRHPVARCDLSRYIPSHTGHPVGRRVPGGTGFMIVSSSGQITPETAHDHEMRCWPGEVDAALGIILNSDGQPADHASIQDTADGGNPGGFRGLHPHRLAGIPAARQHHRGRRLTGAHPELVSNTNWPGSAASSLGVLTVALNQLALSANIKRLAEFVAAVLGPALVADIGAWGNLRVDLGGTGVPAGRRNRRGLEKRHRSAGPWAPTPCVRS